MIAGLQKMTLLDYPGKVACTVFLQGCNWRCPFCHNSGLLPSSGDAGMDENAFFRFLETRKGLLDAVCVSGGEPTLQPDLPGFLLKIKSLGFSVKLDTNGSRPAVLKKLVDMGAVDYVAMDIKNSPARYARTCGISSLRLADVEASIQYLVSGTLPHEFRTTVVSPLHDAVSIREMGSWLSSLVPGQKPQTLFLQRFADRDTVLFSGFSAPDDDEMKHFVSLLSPYVSHVSVRGEQ